MGEKTANNSNFGRGGPMFKGIVSRNPNVVGSVRQNFAIY